MQQETFYFNVTVDYDKSKINELMNQVESFNDTEGRLAYDGVDADNSLQFIYEVEECENKEAAILKVESLKELFQEKISWKLKPMLSELDKKKLEHAVGGRCSKNVYDGRQRWNVRSWQEIVNGLGGTSGYDKLREFLNKYHNFISNNKQLSFKANYNIAIIAEGLQYDKSLIVEAVYDMLCDCNIITDYQIIERGFEPFVDEDGIDDQFYHINEDWRLGERLGPFRRNINKSTLESLRVPRGNYIAFLTPAQYAEVKDLVGFNFSFQHQVVLPALTDKDKFNLLKREAQDFGFGLDDSFAQHEFLQRDMEELLLGLVRAVTHKQYEQNCQAQMLKPEDLGLSQKKATAKEEVDAWTELEAMIGLENVKQLVRKICAFLRKRGRNAVPSLHMVFRGNPGTGKTTVARIIGKLLAEIGLLSPKGIFIEADRRDLVGKYVGHSAPRTAKVVKRAMGGVLFIDEAYALSQKDGFSHETVATLVKLMEDYRDDFVCIMAGYPEEMNDFLDMNPGLRERIQFYIDFPDYTAEEMHAIFLQYCEKEHYQVTTPAINLLDEYFSYMVTHKDRNFANARLVRKIFERIRLNQALRSEGDDIDKEDILTTFEEPDIAKYIHTKSNKIKNIGFVA